MKFIGLVNGMSDDTFSDMVTAAPRKTRETLFTRLNIKAKKQIGLKVHGKLEERTKKLHEKLKTAGSTEFDKLCEELLRNWLFTQRPLLKATLDHLGVKNENGLVDEEPTFFTEMDAEKAKALVAFLKKDFPLEHVHLYLAFMGVPDVGDVVKAAA